MRHIAILAAALALALGLAPLARAGMVEDCSQTRDLDLMISGCSAMIRSGEYSGRILAGVYDNRGIAYKILGEYRRAIEDYDQALRLYPGDAIAYIERGKAYAKLFNTSI